MKKLVSREDLALALANLKSDLFTIETFNITVNSTYADSISSQNCFYIKELGLVYIFCDILVKSGSGSRPIATIPQKYRPSANKSGLTIASNGARFGQAQTNGNILQNSTSSATYVECQFLYII